jgi:hypothetical protein
MRRVLQIALILAFGLNGALAAPVAGFGKLIGRVNNENGSPLAGAAIFLSSSFDFTNSQATAITNRNGEFLVSNVLPGQYAVRVTQQGYQPRLKAPVDVRSGGTTQLILILQNLVSFAQPESADNWDFKTVLRSTRDRRMIFRDRDAPQPVEEVQAFRAPRKDPLFGVVDKTKQIFAQSAAVEAYADGTPDPEGAFSAPVKSGAGMRTNFGYTVPLGEESRYLLAGQLNSGYDSIWKVKNQLDLHLNDFQLWTFNAAYSRIGFPAPRMASLLNPAALSRDGAYVSDLGTFQTLTFGVETFTKILPPLTMVYGLDLALLKGATSFSSFVSQQMQIIFEPTDALAFRATMSSRRSTDADRVKLSTNEFINLAEPFRLFQSGNSIAYDRSMHYELGMARRLPTNATVEFGTYADRMIGASAPILAFIQAPQGEHLNPLQLTREQNGNEGIRVLVNKRFWDFLSSSVAYVYGSGATISGIKIVGDGEVVKGSDLSKEFFHTLTAQVDADVLKTKTFLSTRLRWAPGTPITTIDSFGDEFGLGNGSMRLTVRQVIPVPEMWRMTGQWEALFDIKNRLDWEGNRFQLSPGHFLVLKNPSVIRVGIAYRM